MVRSQDCQRVRPDLVRGIPVRGDPIRTGDDAIDLARSHERGCRGVGDHRVRDARPLELPRCQARPLQQRTGLVDPDALEQAALPGGAKCSDRAAVTAGRQCTGVAMRQRARARAEELGCVLGHGTTTPDFLFMKSPCMRRRRVVTHLLHRPHEVDRGRTRSDELRGGFIEVLPTCCRQRERVRSGDANRGRAANRQLANRLHDVRHRAALELDLFVRQPALVEEDDLRAVLLVPNDVSCF